MEDDLDWAWPELKKCFGLEGEATSCKSPSDDLIAVLEREGILKSTAEYLQSELNHRLRTEVVPAFWKPFREFVADGGLGSEEEDPSAAREAAFNLFRRAVTDLYSRAAAEMAFVHKLSHLAPCHMFQQESYEEMFKLMLQGTLHSQLPKDFEVLVELFYSQAFHVFYVRQDKNHQVTAKSSILSLTIHRLVCNYLLEMVLSCCLGTFMSARKRFNVLLKITDQETSIQICRNMKIPTGVEHFYSVVR